MSGILQDFVPSTLIGAIEANTIESFQTWGRWEKLALHRNENELWIESEIPYFIFNLVLKTGASPADPDSAIDAAISRSTSRNVPMAWWVGPSNPVPDMGQHLEAKGLFHAATLTGMAIDLLTLDEPAYTIPGVTITKVENAHDLQSWCQIMNTISEFPDFAQAAWLEMYQGIRILDDPQWSLYLGSQNGVPVSTSAGIHAVTTQPEFRGRGIGYAMTRAPLLDARSQCYRVGALYSSEMAVNIYLKLGFQEYGKGQIYIWQPPEG